MAHFSIFEEFAKVAQETPHKPAIFFKKDKDKTFQSLSYGELYELSLEFAGLLQEKGIREGDCVSILLANCPYWPVSFLAVQYIGAIAVPLDTRLNAENIKALVIHSHAKAVITSQKLYAGIKQALEQAKHLNVILVDSPEKIESKKIFEIKVPPSDKPAAIFYTSGTTDTPKGVLLSQKNILSNIESMRKSNLTGSRDNFISLLPLHHTYPLIITCLLPLMQGAQITYPSGINSDELLDCIRDRGVSLFVGVPQLFMLIHRQIKEQLERRPFALRLILGLMIELCWLIRQATGINLSKKILARLHKVFGKRLRYMITGGAHLDKEIAFDFFKWGFSILEGYGLTETSPVVSFNAPHRCNIGSVGKPLPDVEVKIINKDSFGIGEIAIKGPNVMLGYYQMPGETKTVLSGGWFLSGDLGYLDRAGYLFITGRKDEVLVLSSGKKINPEEIERHYSSCPYIKEICVFSSQKNKFLKSADQLMAVIVPDEEHFRALGQVNIEEKLKWELDNLSHHLHHYKRITGFTISREPLPRTSIGKLKRRQIEDFFSRSSPVREKKEGGLSQEDQELLSNEICRRMMAYLSERLKKEVHLDDHLELDLGLDSLSRIELLIELQQFLEIEIPEEVGLEIFYASTIKDLVLKTRPYLPNELKEPHGDKFQWSRLLNENPADSVISQIRLNPILLDKVTTFIVKGAFYIFFRVFFLLKIKGRDNLPRKGPCLIYINHTSYLDGFLVASMMPFGMAMNSYIVGFRKYFFFPVVRNLIKTARLIPIDTTLDLVGTLQTCSYLLRNAKIICLFPEGQRSNSEELIQFKKGIGILAKELDIPLLPVYIEGAYRSWSRYRLLPRPAKIKITIGRKISHSEILSNEKIGSRTYEAIAEYLRKELAALQR